MFFAKAALSLLVLPLAMVAAGLLDLRDYPGSSGPTVNCQSGDVQCCNTVTTASALQGSSGDLSGQLLGLVAQLAADVVVGLQCTPIPIIGIASAGCKSQPVCCTNNEFNGLINLGCTPISIL